MGDSTSRQRKAPLDFALYPAEEEKDPVGAMAERAVREAMQRVGDDTTRAAFYVRMLGAVERLATELPATALSVSLAVPNSIQGLLSALAAPDALPLDGDDRELLVRGIDAKRQLLEAEGGTLSAEQVEEILQVSRQQVNNRRKDGKLLAVELGRRGFRYPAWQFVSGHGAVLPGLEQVLQELAGVDPWSQLQFFLEPNPRLVRDEDDAPPTPLAALRGARVDDVRRAARAWQEHGAV